MAKVMSANERYLSWTTLEEQLSGLRDTLIDCEPHEIKQRLIEIVAHPEQRLDSLVELPKFATLDPNIMILAPA